ncbi:MAG TPA: hypothetical protein DEQ47_11490 [Solibacterales bacterium]|nr:hypothetical protein [Bryobacterales bacterium]
MPHFALKTRHSREGGCPNQCRFWQTNNMPSFPGIDPKNHPYVAEMERKTGGENRFFRVLGHSTGALETFVPLYSNVMGPGALDLRIKELVYLAVSYVNECPYCISAHERSAPKAGIGQDEMHNVHMEQDGGFNERERAALVYARELTRTCSVDEGRDQLTKLFSNPELVELTLVIAMANFTNRVNNGLGVDPED